MNDIAKAADPSFESSELLTPVRWLLDALYYIWSYAIEEPLSLVADAALAPITLPLKTITVPLNLFFGDYLKPVYSFFGKQWQMIKNSIWWVVLESISYGSGATADTISEAMQLALNGILQFFTDIGLPLANSAEKLSQITEKAAKTRRKRSVMSAFGSLGGGIGQLIRFPFMLMGGIFSIITFPLRAVFALVTFPFSLLFGSSDEGNLPLTLLLTDMSTQKLTNEVIEAGWKFMKQTGFPELDSIAQEVMNNDMLPKNIKNIISELDSLYKVAKMVGYVE